MAAKSQVSSMGIREVEELAKEGQEMNLKFEANKIYCGNTLDVLKSFPEESINCCITSPPYWALRDYGTDGVVWDGDADCEHEFGQDIIDRRFGNIGTCAGTGNQKNDVMQGTE